MEGTPIKANQRLQILIGFDDVPEIATKIVISAPEYEGYVLGRSDETNTYQPDVDLAIYGAREYGISRRHAALVNHQGQVYLLDLASMNGTFLNENVLQPKVACPLYNGDRIRLANMSLMVRQQQ